MIRASVSMIACVIAAAGTARADHVVAQPAAGEPVPGLTSQQAERFLLGRDRFEHTFGIAQGLGPIYNDTGCAACHDAPLGGAGSQTIVRAGLDSKSGFDPLEEFGGVVFQLQATRDDCLETQPGFANVNGERVTAGMLGYGLVEAIDDADILALADPDDADGDGISGRAHMVEPLESECSPCGPDDLRVGRFGWKAQAASVLTMAADEALGQIGLTNRFRTQENDPNGTNPPSNGLPENCDTVSDPEDNLELGDGVGREYIDVVTDFQRFLAVPPQTPRSGMSGEAIFESIGCAGCHVRDFVTGCGGMIEEPLRCVPIQPYSDFLLHYMGLYGDPFPQGAAEPSEVRTPPLWGLVNRPALWHDGRFDFPIFEERALAAVAAHDDTVDLSEGRFAAEAFAALPLSDQDALLAFLGSLGRREFDVNLDNAVTVVDFHYFGGSESLAQCYGPGPYPPDHSCACHDVDQDGDVDPDDVHVFLEVYDDLRADCNGNGVVDLIDILDGDTTVDENDNGIPDECEPTCAADTDGSGSVGVVEFLGVLGSWGACPPAPAPCPYDLNADDAVEIIDLLTVIGLWGACEG